MGTAMATGVGEATKVADAVERVLAGFDPALVTATDAMALVSVFDRIERMGAAGKSLAAGRVAQTELWRRKGHRSAAHWMAGETGVGVGDAVGVLRTANALAACDATAEAFKAGRVSGRQAKVIAEAATVAPGEAYDADALVAVCEQATNERSVGAAAHAAAAARVAGRDGDASVVLGDDGCARDTSGVSSRGRSARDAKVIVRVDHGALVRGKVACGEVCEIAGIGPVDVATVRDWVQGDAFKAAIVTDGVDIRSVVHLGRRPIELQRTALEWHTAGSCAIEGCTSAARIEIDHVAEWAATGCTTLDELAPVCGHHHDLKTHQGYGFGPLQADGTRRLIPPHNPQDRPPDEPLDSS